MRKFIEDNFLFREDRAEIGDAESLIDAGLIDSTGVLELVAFLEAEFAIKIEDREITPQNLDTLDNIAAYVDAKAAARRSERPVAEAPSPSRRPDELGAGEIV